LKAISEIDIVIAAVEECNFDVDDWIARDRSVVERLFDALFEPPGYTRAAPCPP
jgi:hypothetical protein